MTIDWNRKYSVRAEGMYGSMTRKLMHVMARPGIISFGGGLPAWDLFPVEQVRAVVDDVLRTDGPSALQYSTSEGYRPLREALVERYRARGFDIDIDQVIIDTGSMQGIDLMGKLFLDPGDAVVVGDPTFLTALQAFSAYRARYLTVPLDDDGMQVEQLPGLLADNDVKFIYVMPTFQNPSGRTLSRARREQLLETAAAYGVPILEDDSYGELRYDGEALPPLKALDRHGIVIYLGSFSKVLSPGLRVGFIAAPGGLLEKLVFAKQAADLHTSVIPQRIVHRFLTDGLLDPHIEMIRSAYKLRRDAMLTALERYLPAEACWSHPRGGIFTWVTLPQDIDAGALFDAAVEAGVVYVPGASYYANGGGQNTMRLNFSPYQPDTIEEGVRRLAGVIANRS